MENKELLKIVHQENQRFPLNISDKLEKKIRVLCNKFPYTEWSGQLFYSYTGSFEQGNIVFTAEDLLFMDIGDGVATEFYLDESNAAAYMADHELWNCQVGLIHSHHSMAAFFSGQDDAMLRQEGTERNHFLSLVVNNEGKYVAKITVKEQRESDIHTKVKYHTFNDIEVEQFVKETKTDEVIVSTYNLDIIKTSSVCDDYEELMETITNCIKVKTERIAREREKQIQTYSPYYTSQGGYGGGKKKKEKKKEKNKYGNYQPADKQSYVSKSSENNDYPVVPSTASQLTSASTKSVEVPNEVLDDNRVAYYATQILSLGFFCTNHENIEELLKCLDTFVTARFGNMANYKEALAFMVDYLLDTELANEIDAAYSPEVIDAALTTAEEQIASYFFDLMTEHEDNIYLETIYNYLTR